MPRWLRLFTFDRINEFYKNEQEQMEKSKPNNKNVKTIFDSNGNINKSAVPKEQLMAKAKTPPKYK